MNPSEKRLFVIGTCHRLQGAPYYPKSVADPGYTDCLNSVIAEENVDFIFEEASRCTPTTAEKLAASLTIRYLDVDPSPGERGEFGIVDFAGKPFPVENHLMTAELFVEEHVARERVWERRILGKDFQSGLLICGHLHTLSLAIKFRLAGFRVKYRSYLPHDKLCTHTQPSQS